MYQKKHTFIINGKVVTSHVHRNSSIWIYSRSHQYRLNKQNKSYNLEKALDAIWMNDWL